MGEDVIVGETRKVEPYPVGSYGPESVKRLIAPFHWHLPHI